MDNREIDEAWGLRDRCPECQCSLRDPQDELNGYSAIGVTHSEFYDGVLYWKCPDCGAVWNGFPPAYYLAERAKAAMEIHEAVPQRPTPPLPTALPTWDEMDDDDRGAALFFLFMIDTTGMIAAQQNTPVIYVNDPRLTALSSDDACRHARKTAGTHQDCSTPDLKAEYDRLVRRANQDRLNESPAVEEG